MKHYNRFFAMLLAVCLLVSLLPVQLVHAVAEDEAVVTTAEADTLTLYLRDSEKDGWDGNQLALYIDDVFVRNYTASGSSSTFTVAYETNQSYTFKWVKGSYADECSFTISLGDTTLFSASRSDCEDYADGQVVFTYGRTAEKITGGSCGTNLIWEFFDNGVLQISGSGVMKAYSTSSSSRAPWYSYRDQITRIHIKDGVTSIGDYAFNSCAKMQSIRIPDGVTSFGTNAFRDCDALQQIMIPDSVTSMSTSVFYSCNSLRNVTLPTGISLLNTALFQDCVSLESITIPANVTKIGADVFSGCSGLRCVDIMGNVTSIGNYAFKNCSGLNEVVFTGTAPTFSSSTFSGTVTSAYYNRANTGWTSSVLKSYGGTVTWYGGPTASGSGTQSSPYIINSEADLRRVALFVRNGMATQGIYFRLGKNISLAKNWTPIGTKENPFHGSFDGNNYEISNMTIQGDYSGLFGYIGSGAEIKNVDLTDANVSGTCYVAGLVAYADAGTGAITIADCSVNGTLTDTYDSYPDGYLAGIVAYANAESGSITITGCTSSGSYLCDYYSGGIVGYGKGKDHSLKLINCTNRAGIGVGYDGNNCGGIAGCLSNVELISCLNYGNVSGNAYSEDNGSSWLGGITGLGSECTFKGCANFGEISTFFAGGITASQSGGNVADSCLNAGKLTHSSDGYGHAILYIYSTTNAVINSYYRYGTGMTGAEYVSGSELTSGAAAHAMREYFGQIIGVDDMPVRLTANPNNRVYKVTVIGETSGSFYTNYGKTVELPELSSCAAYFDGENKFDPATPITRDYALAAKGYHNYVEGVCKYCGNEGVDYVDVGTCGESAAWTVSQNGVLTISGSGAMADYSATNPAPWNAYASQIQSVRITDGVTTIGNYAFKELINTTSVTIGKTVTTIGDYAFNGLTNLTEITIPDAVAEIGDYAFASCTGLTDITLGKWLETIGNYAFYQCTGLDSVSIPNKVTTLGDGAFRGCTLLQYLYLYNGLETIGAYAFLETSVADLSIPATVSKIGDYAFGNCSELWQITFRGTAPEIAAMAFSGDTVTCHVPDYDSSWTSVVNKQYGGTLTWAMGSGACGNSVTWVLDFDGTLTISGTGAMYGYSGTSSLPWSSLQEKILSVIVSNGVTSIGDYAFSGCSNLRSVTIADSVTQIGKAGYSNTGRSFANCTSLTQFTVPKNVKEIAESTFYGCTGLTAITVASGNTAFSSADGVLYDYYQDTLHTYPAGKTGTFTIPSGVNTISRYAFAACDGLTEVAIPSTVTAIDAYAFGYCDGLSKITFTGNAPTIHSDSFWQVTATVDYPTSDTTWTGDKLKNYGGTLTWNAGSGSCGTGVQWKLVYSNGSAALTISGTGAMTNYTFDTVPWKDHLAYIKTFEVCDGVTSVGAYALNPGNSSDAATSLTTVKLADSVTSIGNDAFLFCTKLNTLTLGNGIRTIGDSAFVSTALTEIHFPDSLQTIGKETFEYCRSLKTVTFGSGMQSIGYTAFAGCTALQTVDLGSSVTTLEQSAFNGCSKLTKMVIPASVTSVGTYAFRNCTSLQYVEFQGNAPTINTDAFAGTTCHAYYNPAKSNWTSSKWVNYGGSLTWGALSQRGTCGSNAEWLLDTSGNLYICGSGAMATYSETSKAPWYDYRANIKKVKLQGVTSIGAYAFSGCDAIVEVSVGSSVYSVNNYAFADCKALQVVIFDGSAPSFGANAFSGTTCEMWYLNSWSASVRKDYGGTLTWRNTTARGSCGTNAKWALDNTGTLVVLGTGTMNSYSSSTQPWYSNKTSIKYVVIGGKVTSVGNYAFNGHTALQSVTIGESVTSIGNYAFSNCSALQTITFHGSAPSITSYAFNKVTATASYPLTNTSWTTSKRQNYGGTITWEAVCTKHNETVAAAVEATCTTTGLTEGSYCSLCKEALVPQEVIPAKGHFAIGPDNTEVPVDTLEADCLNDIVCTVCHKVAKAALGHRVLGTTLVETDPLTITNTSTYPYKLTNGTYYSTNTSNRSSSELRITAQYACTLTLNYGVSSEKDYDELSILKNGSEQHTISGEVTDQTLTLALAAGDIVTVRYKKDSSDKAGQDRGWVTLVYDFVMAEGIGDVPAETAEPGCTDGVVCRYCQTVVKEALGHRVILQLPEPEIPFEVINTAAVPFELTDGIYYSANHGASSASDLQIKAKSECTLTLNYGVSSESGCDKLTILLNNAAKDTISGEVTNKTLTLNLAAGDSITVRYSKDSSVNRFDDRGWVSVQYKSEPAVEIVPADSIEADCDGVICDYCHEIAKAGLGHDLVTDEGYAATCTAPGLTDGVHCSRCEDATVGQEEIPMLGHDMVADEGYAATCAKPGKTDGEHCSRCEDMTVAQEEIPMLGHDMVTDEGYAATCTTPGLTDGRHCSRCEEATIAREEIPVLGHDMVTDEGYAATCTVPGLTNGAHCSRCEDATVAQIVIPATGVHTFVENVCQQCGLVGGACGEELSWSLDSSGKLTISGTGAMDNNWNSSSMPWHNYRDEIKTVVVESGVTTIGSYAFYECKQLQSVILPDGIETIGQSAFFGCASLEKIQLPDSVTSINGSAFFLCDGLMEIYIPENISTIGSGAFFGCTALKKVTFGGAAPIIGSDAFYSVTADCYHPTEDPTWTDSAKQSYGGTLTWMPDCCMDGHTEAVDEEVAATCTATGLTAGSHCFACGKTLIRQEEIPMLGHDMVTDEGYAATCTTPGLTDGAHCSRCADATVAQEEIPMLGHDMVTDEGYAATCTTPGLTDGAHCSRCADATVAQEEIPMLGHDMVTDEGYAATCTVPGLTDGEHCTRCEDATIAQEAIPVLDHAYTYTVAEKPNETNPGKLIGQCSGCTEKDDVTLPALHEADYAYTITRAPTADEPGIGLYTWKDTTYGTFSFEVELPKTGVTLSGTVTSYGGETDNVTIELIDGDGNIAYTVTVSGNTAIYEIPGVATGTYTVQISKKNHITWTEEITVEADSELDVKIYLKGDVTGDGKVDIKDYSRVLSHVKKLSPITDEYILKVVDVTNDGKVDIKDYSRILAHVKKLNPLF